MTKPPKPVSVLDSEFEHWHVLGPILWAGVAYGGAGVLDLLDVPTLYVAGVGALVSLLAPLVTIYKRFSFLLMAATTALLFMGVMTAVAVAPVVILPALGVAGARALQSRVITRAQLSEALTILENALDVASSDLR